MDIYLPISLTDAITRAKEAQLRVTCTEDRVIVMEMAKTSRTSTITIVNSKTMLRELISKQQIEVSIAIGRENTSPFEFNRELRLFDAPLETWRSIQIESKKDAIALVNAAMFKGTSVDDDFYLFPANGAYLLYISHHDEAILEQ